VLLTGVVSSEQDENNETKINKINIYTKWEGEATVLDLDWVINSLKEARDDEDWDLVKEIISYLENQNDFDMDDWTEND